MNLKEFEWKWKYYTKSRWMNMYVVDIDGVFIKKMLECDTFKPNPVHEIIFWFSHNIGTLVGLGHMYFKTDSWCVEEKESNWIAHNKDKTAWNSKGKDDFDYIEFATSKKCLIITEENYERQYIIGVLIDLDTILNELLR